MSEMTNAQVALTAAARENMTADTIIDRADKFLRWLEDNE